jgi:hypothetical protein
VKFIRRAEVAQKTYRLRILITGMSFVFFITHSTRDRTKTVLRIFLAVLLKRKETKTNWNQNSLKVNRSTRTGSTVVFYYFENNLLLGH